uniref:Uncharacterized protein n=1 Tax=Anopheles christyi TaxID=43041 RepID=A0A182KIE2_9DIPT
MFRSVWIASVYLRACILACALIQLLIHSLHCGAMVASTISEFTSMPLTPSVSRPSIASNASGHSLSTSLYVPIALLSWPWLWQSLLSNMFTFGVRCFSASDCSKTIASR